MTPAEANRRLIEARHRCARKATGLIWIGRTDSCDYGEIKHDHRSYKTHRISFLARHGHWPYPQCLHQCDRRPCLNPDHLYEGDHAQNMRDLAERGTCAQGHAKTPGSMYVRPNGDRYCRECQRERLREWRAEQRAKGRTPK